RAAESPLDPQLRQERELRGTHFMLAGSVIVTAGAVAGLVAMFTFARGTAWELEDAGCTAACKDDLAYNHRLGNAAMGSMLATTAIGGALLLWGAHLQSQ